jgi:cytochrome c553
MRLDRLATMLIVGAALAFPAMNASAGDAERGRTLAYTCMGCHGVASYKNAYPKYSVPKLGGQNEAYLVAALEGYATGDRPHSTMKGQASMITAEDRADLAAWFASVVPSEAGEAQAGTPPAMAEACAACHGQNGAGTTNEYPDIGGQHADYLAKALDDYRLGKRKNPIMAPFAQQLSHDDIEAIAEYFSEQPGLRDPELEE